MAHPTTFLATGQRLEPHLWEMLRNECSTQQEGPETDEITFTFSARENQDQYDRTIVANRRSNTFRCEPQPHCACPRDPLECECCETECAVCSAEFTAHTPVCEMEFCVGDDCPLCQHQRETCMYQDVLEAVQDGAARRIRQSGDSIAAAHVNAVAGVFAPGVGDAPLFPAVTRVLNELLGGDQGGPGDQGNQQPMGEIAWNCPDGSRVMHDPNSPGWLTWDEPSTQEEKE